MSSASRITPSQITSPKVITDDLQIGNQTIVGITSDPMSQAPDLLPSTMALSIAVTQLRDEMSGLVNPDGPGFTDPIVDPQFTDNTVDPDLGWSIRGWTTDMTGTYITNAVSGGYDPDNYLRVPAGKFTVAGTYFIVLTVPEIHGKIEVFQNSTSLGEVTQTGSHAFGVKINNPTAEEVTIVASDIPSGQRIRLTEGLVVGVPDLLAAYVEFKVVNVIRGLELVLDSDLQQAIAEHVAAADPHVQYYRKTDALIDRKANRSLPSYRAAAFSSSWLRAPLTFRTARLCHAEKGPYDQASGRISSTVSPTSPISDAVDAAMLESVRMAFFPEEFLTTLVYKLHETRAISAIDLYLDTASTRGITQVTIVAGSTTRTETIVPTGNHHTVTITFSSIAVTDTVIIIVDSLSSTGGVLAQYALGFDIVFGDVPSGIAVLRPSFTGVSGSAGGAVTVSTVASTAISLLGLPYDKPYGISLVNNSQIVVDAVPPQYSLDGLYAYPLRELIHSESAYYGETEIDAPNDDYPFDSPYEIYLTDRIEERFSSEGLILTHEYPNPVPLREIAIHLSNAEYLDDIVLAVTKSGGTVSSYTRTQFSVSAHQDGSATFRLILPENFGTSTRVELSLVPLTGEAIGIDHIDLGLAVASYDHGTCRWSDGSTRVFLGTIIPLLTGRCAIVPAPADGGVSLTVSGGERTPFGTVVRMPNPFRHTAIDISPNKEVFGMKITPDTISCITAAEGVFTFDLTSRV